MADRAPGPRHDSAGDRAGGPASEHALKNAVSDALDAVRERFEERYGDDLSQLSLRLIEPANEERAVARVTGTVVVAKQLRTLRRELRARFGDAEHVELDVGVLADLSSSDDRVDGRVVDHPAGSTVAVWSRRQGGKLATEWVAGDDPARVLVEATPRRLLQLSDGTVGWVDCSAGWLRATDAEGVAFELRRLADGATAPVSDAQRQRLLDAARGAAAAGITYRLGGADPTKGLDCSSFVQRLLDDHVGILLPRHTGDQLRIGERIGRAEIDAGDLVFARAKTKRWQHVALALDGTGDAREVAHACRLDGRVRLEPLEAFLGRYRYLRTQRVLVAADEHTPSEESGL